MTRRPSRAGACAALACGLVLAALDARAEELLYGRIVSGVELTGVNGATRLLGQVPVRVKQPLTRRALQQGVRVLYRSGRFARVGSWVEPQEDGSVKVRFDVEPVRRVSRLTFVGLASLDERALVRAADLPAGTEFSPGRITEAAARIASAYFQAGWREAQVRWDATPLQGDELAIDFAVQEGSSTTLVQLEFTGALGLPRPEIDAAFEITPGGLLELGAVSRGMDALRLRLRRQGFFRSRVGEPRVDAAEGRAVVTIPIDAGPRFRLQIRGNRTFGEARLREALRYAGDEPLDPGLMRDLAERLRAFYEVAGFPDAKVGVHESEGPPEQPPAPDPRANWRDLQGRSLLPAIEAPPAAARLVTFLVTEGESVRVVERVYEGGTYFDRANLDRRVVVALEDGVPEELVLVRESGASHAAWRAPGSGGDVAGPHRVVPDEVFSRAAYRNACSQIADLYKSQGFLDASAGPVRLERLGGGRARAVVPIQEGPRTAVAELRFEGAEQIPEAELLPVVTLQAGAPLSYFTVEESRQAIAALYASRGHFFVQVEDEEEIDESGRHAKVVFRVQEGPRLRVSRVELKGVSRTDPQLLRGVLALREGDPVTPQARAESVRNLMRLGLFTSASVDPADPDITEAEKALVVEVREKPSLVFDARGGASSADGPRASVQATWGNLWGRNVSFTGGLKLNVPVLRFQQECPSCDWPDDPLERRVFAGLVVPRYRAAGEKPLDLRFDLLHENVLRPAYQLTRYAALASIDAGSLGRLGPFEVSTLAQLEFERDAFLNRDTLLEDFYETLSDRQAKLLPEGTILLVSLRPQLTLDARDDKLNPTRGLVVGVAADLARSLSAVYAKDDRPFTIALARLLMTASGYVPVYPQRRVVVALGGRLGYVFSSDRTSIIGTKRFFLGGTQSLRGFNEDGVVPEDVRRDIAEAKARCDALASGIGCAPSDDAGSTATGSGTNAGGTLLVAGRAELRVGLGETLDGALFTDAGNLWFDPGRADLRDLRVSVGAGVRLALPIGPAALDAAVNLNRDDLVNEPTFRIHLAVGLF